MRKWMYWGSILVTILILAGCSQTPTNTAPSNEVSTGRIKDATSSVPATSSEAPTETVPQQDDSQEPPQEAAESTADMNVSLLPIQDRKKILSVTPQLQHVWYYCAPTTVSMMLSYLGKTVSQEQLAQEMGTHEPFGTHNQDAIRVLNQQLFGYDSPQEGQAGYRLETVTAVDVATLKTFKDRLVKNIDDGYPMYYTFWVEKIYPGKKGEHNVIGMGYELSEDGNDVTGVYYLDPSPSVQDPTYGGLKKVTPAELLDAMLPCQEPNYAW